MPNGETLKKWIKNNATSIVMVVVVIGGLSASDLVGIAQRSAVESERVKTIEQALQTKADRSEINGHIGNLTQRLDEAESDIQSMRDELRGDMREMLQRMSRVESKLDSLTERLNRMGVLAPVRDSALWSLLLGERRLSHR